MIWLQLYFAFLKIGAFSFGGGYAMIPLIMEETIHIHRWIEKNDFIDILAISQITPGPIATNLATFLGFKIGGIPGSVVATIAVITPSFFVISIMFLFITKFRDNRYVNWFFEGIKPVVIGLIGAGFLSVFSEGVTTVISWIIFIWAFYLVTFKKVHPIPVMILCGMIGLILY